MVVVTDALDRDTIARWRQRAEALRDDMDRVWETPAARGQRDAWYALGNAIHGCDAALGFLDQARAGLQRSGGGDDGA